MRRDDRKKECWKMKILREPLLHFFLIGAAIYGAYAIYGAPVDEGGGDERRIVVDKAQVDGFVAAWQARWSRPPTEQELDGLIKRFIRESIYYREAVAMGLDQDDPITRRRMAQKLEFLTKDIAAMKQPADGELERFFEDNRDDYRAPDLISFTHVFIDPDKRGDATLDDAKALLAQLTAIGPPDAATADKGDRFLLRNEFVQQSELEVRKSLGSGFAASVMQLEPGQWHGPVLSGYGTHLVFVSALEPAPDPSLEAVKDEVLQDWQAGQQEIIEGQFYEELKSRYEIVIEELPASPYTGRGSAAEVTGGAADRSGSAS